MNLTLRSDRSNLFFSEKWDFTFAARAEQGKIPRRKYALPQHPLTTLPCII